MFQRLQFTLQWQRDKCLIAIRNAVLSHLRIPNGSVREYGGKYNVVILVWIIVSSELKHKSRGLVQKIVCLKGAAAKSPIVVTALILLILWINNHCRYRSKKTDI